MTSLFAIRGAVASVALSHPEGCACLTCRAAGGDREAFLEIVVKMEDRA